MCDTKHSLARMRTPLRCKQGLNRRTQTRAKRHTHTCSSQTCMLQFVKSVGVLEPGKKSSNCNTSAEITGRGCEVDAFLQMSFIMILCFEEL